MLSISQLNAAVVTKTATFSTVSVDNNYTLLTPVTFVSGVDFPASHLIASVTTSITFRKTKGSCASPSPGNPNNNEAYFRIIGPITTVNIANAGTWGTNTSSGIVSVNFSQTAGAAPGGAAPTSGTFLPNGGSLNTYVGASPFGTWRIGAGDNGANDPLCVLSYSITITTYDPLPIKLLSFQAEMTQENRKVDLLWSTATEMNNDFFTIEKSKNGLNWDILSTYPSVGNSHQKLNYSAVDLTPYAGISYYRLKQTDFNGMSETFPAVSINNNADEIEIFRIDNRVLITGNFSEIKLINLAGQTISISEVTNQGVAYENYVSGIYIIQYNSEGLIYQKKIIL